MRIVFTLAMMLASVVSLFAQSSRIVGGVDANGKQITGYQVGSNPVQWERQEIVPAPTQAPIFQDARHPYQWSNHSWNGDPFIWPFPGGTYEIRNCSVDKTQKAGAWSQPAIVTVQSGAQFWCGGWNLPPLQYEAGVVWKCKVVSIDPEDADHGLNPGDEFHLGYGIEHLQGGNTSPFVACDPELMKLARQAPYNYNLSRLTFGGDYQTVAPPPVVVATSIPNRRFRVAYCFVAENGETALSPPTPWSDPATQPGWGQAKVVEFQLNIRNYFPQGCLGYRVYLQMENDSEPWRRLPASHCHGVPASDDDWLFQLWDRQPLCWTYRADAPVHAPVVQPKSTLTGLHLALKETGWFPWNPVSCDIVVEVDKINISCPVHDEWGSFGTGHPFKFGRKIMSANMREWYIIQTPTGSSRYWPVVHVSNSYSRWWFCTMQGNGASAALSYDDMAGGQTFGNKFWETKMMAGTSTTCGGLSYGMIVSERSTGSRGNHTHSEGRYFDCTIGGDVCIKLGGNQTANINFSDTLSSCNSGTLSKGRRNTALWLLCPNEVRFRGLWGADSFSGPLVYVSGFDAKLNCDHIWKDQLSSAVFECQTARRLDVEVRAGKFNLWSTPGYEPTLARFAHTYSAPSRISLKGVQSQYSYWPTTADVLSPRPHMAEMIFDQTTLSDQVALVEPNYSEWSSEWLATYFAWSPVPPLPPIPGMHMTVPAQVIPAQTVPFTVAVPVAAGSRDKSTTTVTGSVTIPSQTLPAKTITVNSFTGREQVQRRPWK